MNIKDVIMKGGILPAMLSEKMTAKNDEIEELKKKVAAGAAGTQAVAGQQAPSGQGMKKGGMTASRRADGIASRGKTRGKLC
jgi:hypothetical protein